MQLFGEFERIITHFLSEEGAGYKLGKGIAEVITERWAVVCSALTEMHTIRPVEPVKKEWTSRRAEFVSLAALHEQGTHFKHGQQIKFC